MSEEGKKDALKDNSYQFALKIILLCRKLQIEEREYIISKQLAKSGTSIGANIEEASGAQSTNDFIAKFHISLKEARESNYWLRLLKDSSLITLEEYDELIKELNFIMNMLTKSLKTAKKNLEKEQGKK
ncbi:MAG: four helix bundle protein [Bacteroidales bacterium]|nr:four helix bundle protein [Bacteroidales bacterium]